jgi:hypothetical protein
VNLGHPRVAMEIKKNALIIRENFGNLARLIIREKSYTIQNRTKYIYTLLLDSRLTKFRYALDLAERCSRQSTDSQIDSIMQCTLRFSVASD